MPPRALDDLRYNIAGLPHTKENTSNRGVTSTNANAAFEWIITLLPLGERLRPDKIASLGIQDTAEDLDERARLLVLNRPGCGWVHTKEEAAGANMLEGVVRLIRENFYSPSDPPGVFKMMQRTLFTLLPAAVSAMAFPQQTGSPTITPTPSSSTSSDAGASLITTAPGLTCTGGSTVLFTQDCTYGNPISYCYSPPPPISCATGSFPSVWHPGNSDP